jgi:predicted Fe-S protein YdhL (DUF1289 family)
MSIESPCIKVCVIDPASTLCRGCGRSLGEIGAWSTLSPHQREAIMAALPRRMLDAGLADPLREP